MDDRAYESSEMSSRGQRGTLETLPASAATVPATWKLKRCLDEDYWPGYPPAVATAEMPAYEEMRWLEREAREEMAA